MSMTLEEKQARKKVIDNVLYYFLGMGAQSFKVTDFMRKCKSLHEGDPDVSPKMEFWASRASYFYDRAIIALEGRVREGQLRKVEHSYPRRYEFTVSVPHPVQYADAEFTVKEPSWWRKLLRRFLSYLLEKI
jgi:hypothetical protein